MEEGAMNIRARIRNWSQRRWPATRLAARLGIVAAILSGLALAFHVGGQDGYVLPLTALLGAPTNGLLFEGLRHLVSVPANLIASAGPRSQWDIWHLVFCGAVALNWTLVGLAVDLCGREPEAPMSPSAVADNPSGALSEGDELNAAFEDLERRVREREGEPRRLLVRRAA
jgi:hypothetical protein